MPGITQALRMRVKEVRIQGEDDGGFIESIVGCHWVAESQARPFMHIIQVDRLELMPLRFWEPLQQIRKLPGQRRRGNRLREKPQTRTGLRFLLGKHLVETGEK